MKFFNTSCTRDQQCFTFWDLSHTNWQRVKSQYFHNLQGYLSSIPHHRPALFHWCLFLIVNFMALLSVLDIRTNEEHQWNRSSLLAIHIPIVSHFFCLISSKFQHFFWNFVVSEKYCKETSGNKSEKTWLELCSERYDIPKTRNSLLTFLVMKLAPIVVLETHNTTATTFW